MADYDPSVRSTDYGTMEPFWTKVADILGGETAIKKKGRTYLPLQPEESDANYAYRLSIATFTNIYADISKNLASKPFAKELVLTEKSDQQFLDLAENIDGQGNNLHVFSEAAFKSGQDFTVSWILVDYTKPAQRKDGRPLSKAEEAEQGLRPYWVHIPALKVLAAYSAFIGGKEVLFHVRVDESATVFDGVSESTVERVRVMKRDPLIDETTGSVVNYGPAHWELWEKKAKTTGRTKSSSWDMVDSGEYSIGVIPMVPFFAGKRIGTSFSASALLGDLTDMQLAEYRKESDLEFTRVMTCFPMLQLSGVEIKDKSGKVIVKVGPSQIIGIPQNKQGTGPAGEAKYVEPTTASIQEMRAQLELQRKEMRDLGMQPLSSANLTVVTTKNVSLKASSAMQMLAILFKDALEQAWEITGLWLKNQNAPEVVVHMDFSVELEEGKELDTILGAVDRKVLSRQTARSELKRRGVVSNDLTEADEEERLAEESAGLEPEQPIDPKTGKPLQRVA